MSNIIAMMERRRQILGAVNELPSGYTRLNYIENTSDAYIETGVAFSYYLKTILDVERNSTADAQDMIIFGCRAGTTGAQKHMCFNTTANKLSFQAGGTNYTDVLFSSRTTYIFDGNQYPSIQDKDGNLLSYYTTAPTYTGTIKLFAGITGTTLDSRRFKGKIYACKIANETGLVRDYVPCTNPSNVVGLFDKVNNVFYGSDNSTPFSGQ